MANRKNTFLIKRSNVAGKVPAAGDLQLGELALNTADNILYASGTTANSILPIGWDRVARTGDTMTGYLYAPSISATTISATTYYNLPTDIFTTGGTYSNITGIATFTNNSGGTFNVAGFSTGGGSVFTGGTVAGPTVFTSGLSANTISATTYYNLPTDVFVTGGTYTSGNAIFTNNTGGTFTVSGFNVGGGGGQVFYLNLSQSQNGNRLLSTTASTASEQTSGVTIANGVTSTIASFQSQPLNITLLPGGIWSFYLHSYKQNNNASFNIFVELYKRTSGGTETLLFATDPAPVTTNSPNPSMQLSDGYFSGTSLNVSDSVVSVVRATNTGNQSHIITLVTEGSAHYSYVVSTIPTQQGLTCDTLSGCSIIQTIQTDISNKFDKSGGTVNGATNFTNGLSATTISATTYFNLPINTDVFVTGATYSNNTFTYINNTGGTFNVLFNTVTGLTVNGNLTVTGSTQSWFSGDSSSDLVRITQTGSGNAFVVEDSNNPDGTPFVIDNAGNVGIGNPSPGGTAAKLTVQSSDTEGSVRIGGGNGTGNARLFLQSSTTNAYIDMYGNSGYLPLKIDAAPLKLNTTEGSGNVGIGAETPTAKLHINNTVNQNSFLVEDDTNPDSTPFVIDANGNVGMGTLTPASVLHVKANPSSESMATIRLESAAVTANSSIGHYSAGVHRWEVGTGINLATQYEIFDRVAGQTRFSITTSGAAVFPNGNVGIGTTTPIAKLDISGDTRISGGLTANTISATTYFNLPIDIRVTGGTYAAGTATFINNTGDTFTVTGFSTGTTTGLGTTNYLPKWTGTTGLGNSQIRDDGTNIAIGMAPDTDNKFSIITYSNNYYGLWVRNASNLSGAKGIYGLSNGNVGTQTGVWGVGEGHPTTGTSIGVDGGATNGLLGIGVRGIVGVSEFGSMVTGIGGYFDGRGGGEYGYPTTSYSVQLLDNTEGINKVLVSKTIDGKANWSSSLSGLTGVYTNTLSATTINATNLTVTGGTQSLFSGSSSVEMVKIIQAGSGDAFVVQDQANGDSSHFVINASGNTAIGLTAPIGNDKLTVSGNTTVYGTLSATTYAGLPNSGVLVVPIATSSVAVGTGSNDYYLNFKIPYNLTISKVDFSVSTAGSDSVRIGIYRGQDLTAVLVGQSAGGTVSTLNSVPIVAEVGQNLTFSAGSWVVIGVAVGGTTTNLYGSACPANNLIAWTNTTDSSGGFPTNPRAKSATRTSFPSIEITVA